MTDVCEAEAQSKLTVASLFAGCGGSSLGYRLAGFRVAYANEFDARVARVYDLNKSPGTVLDVSDVRDLTGAVLLERAGVMPDVLDGSAPCSDWSLMGNRELDGPRATLYGEFVRVVGELRPRAFVAENVLGIVMGDAKPRFAALLAELRGHGYRVAASYLDASRYDVPQKRERVVVIGFRDDLGLDPAAAFPSPGPVCVMRDVGISALVVEEIGRSLTRYGYLHDHIWDGAAPAPTITTRGPGPLSWSVVRVKTPSVQRKATPDDVRRLCGFPEGFDLGDAAFATAALVYGNAVPPGMSAAWATGVHDQLRTRV